MKNDALRIEIGERLRFLREGKQRRQVELARLLELSPSEYTKLESGDRGLRCEDCAALANYYGVSCDFIIRGDHPAERCRQKSKRLQGLADDVMLIAGRMTNIAHSMMRSEE